MLVFNTNIYERGDAPIIPVTYSQSWPGERADAVDALHLFSTALASDEALFRELLQQDTKAALNNLAVFFPHASGFGGAGVLQAICQRLSAGLADAERWYKMNSYHFCYLYDSINNLVEEYCYGDSEKRRELIPELNGATIDFNWFLNTYFFHTAFLIDPERYDEREKRQKERFEEWSPNLFAVIHRLAPSAQEIELEVCPGKPYAPSRISGLTHPDVKRANLYGHGRSIRER